MAVDDVDYAGGKGQKKGMGAKVRSCCNSLYNPQKKELLGRTCGSWAKIGAFYLVFYSCLAGFFAIMLVGFFATVSDDQPTMMDMYSLIKQNPGVGFKPMPNHDSTLIRINTSNSDTYANKIQDIVAFLKENNYIMGDDNVPSNITQDSNKNDTFSIKQFESTPCYLEKDAKNINDSYGYKDGKPCVMLKINRVFNWVPEPLQGMTNKYGDNGTALLGDRYDPHYIGVSCEGENDGDKDNIGHMNFYPDPGHGFSYQYFPYKNYKNYRSPLVFVQFPKVKEGVVIQIWCKIWAYNIMFHKNDKAGSVHFELMVN
jgi:sodium/potassium-transporting ATPase subunit beta